VSANPASAQRTATITFTAGTLTKTVTVAQAGAPLVLNVEPSTITATYMAGSYTVAVTSNAAWTATVSAGATWCTASPATGTGNRTVQVNIAENSATVTRAATVTFSAGTLQKMVDINQFAQPLVYMADDAPPYAASQRVWIFGSQTWSDAIKIPECNKGSYSTQRCAVSCRRWNSTYLYNQHYAYENQLSLCPSPWHIPSSEDIELLEIAAPGATLSQQWGGCTRTTINGLYDDPTGCSIWYEPSKCHDDWYLEFFYYEKGTSSFAVAGQCIWNAVRCVK
jgi:hypothetical protein